MNDLATRLNAALSDRYVIDRELGSGGMAVVYVAHDVRHDRTVALKVLRPDLIASASDARFLQEIRIAAGLQHPNILPLYDSGSVDGLHRDVDLESLRGRQDFELLSSPVR